MKILKGIFVYTMIILGVIMGLGIILLGCMYLFKMSMFGYKFLDINLKRNTFESIQLDIKEQQTSGSTLSYLDDCVVDGKYNVKFVINAGNYTVRVLPDSGQHSFISYYTISDFVGFVKTDTSSYKASVNTRYYINDDTLIVDMKVSNPKGLINFDATDNRLVIVVPEKYNNKPFYYGFDITTTGGDIILKNSLTSDNKFDAPLRVSTLTANTTKGNITLGGFESTIVDGEKEASSTATMQNLVLTTQGGTIDFTNFKSFVIEKKLILEATKADYIFEDLTVNDGMEVTGSNILIKANTITCNGDFVYKSDTGGLDIQVLNAGEYNKVVSENKYHYVDANSRLHNITIFSDSTNIKIGAIMGKARIENQYGSIDITNLCNQATIKNENGNITITNSGVLPKTDDTSAVYTKTSSLVVYNTYGDITVKSYRQNGLFTNVKGKITLTSDAEVVDRDNAYYTKVTSKDGNVKFINTNGSAYSIVGTDKADINIEQKKVSAVLTGDEENKTYYVKSTNGGVNITLPTTNSGYAGGYIMNVNGKFASTPKSSFSDLKTDCYQWYFTGDSAKPNAGVIPTADIATELQSFPLVKIVSKNLYVNSSL